MRNLFKSLRAFGPKTLGPMTAALAIASILPKHPHAERDASFTVIGVTADTASDEAVRAEKNMSLELANQIAMISGRMNDDASDASVAAC